VFADQLASWQFIVIQIAAAIPVVLVFRLPWFRWLGLDDKIGKGEPDGDARAG
jgi:hypothetical protein